MLTQTQYHALCADLPASTRLQDTQAQLTALVDVFDALLTALEDCHHTVALGPLRRFQDRLTGLGAALEVAHDAVVAEETRLLTALEAHAVHWAR